MNFFENAPIDRRTALKASLGMTLAGAIKGVPGRIAYGAGSEMRKKMRLGLVTYMWGAKWDIDTLIYNCHKAGLLGVELRTGHAHEVEPKLDVRARAAVKKRFADSPVQLVGLGCNEDFHDLDQDSLRSSIAVAKSFIKLSHDVGGSGVKVKPNDLPVEVAKEQTIEQIGRSLNELAVYADGYGQEVRLEVHGGCARLPVIASIMKIADHPNATVCWNSNPQDLEDGGLERNFNLVKKRLGSTVHVRALNDVVYPYGQLFKLLRQVDYDGWLLIEDSTTIDDPALAMARERAAFERLSAG